MVSPATNVVGRVAPRAPRLKPKPCNYPSSRLKTVAGRSNGINGKSTGGMLTAVTFYLSFNFWNNP